jgi:hypothetical protein
MIVVLVVAPSWGGGDSYGAKVHKYLQKRKSSIDAKTIEYL